MTAGPGTRWRLFDFAPERLDALPFGAIVVDRDGGIREYNEYETKLSRLDRARVVGKNFFHDVAPCTAVQAFEGHFAEFLKTKSQVSESFDYFFAFAHGAVDVTVTFLKMPERDRILIAIERVDRRG